MFRVNIIIILLIIVLSAEAQQTPVNTLGYGDQWILGTLYAEAVQAIIDDATITDPAEYFTDDRILQILYGLHARINVLDSSASLSADEYIPKTITRLGSGTPDEVTLPDSYISNSVRLSVYGRQWNPQTVITLAAGNWEFAESTNGVTPRHAIPSGAQVIIDYLKLHLIEYLIDESGNYLIGEDDYFIISHESDDY